MEKEHTPDGLGVAELFWRRVAVCVRFCDDHTTEALESGELVLVNKADLRGLVEAARHQRDRSPGAQPQLLAALAKFKGVV